MYHQSSSRSSKEISTGEKVLGLGMFSARYFNTPVIQMLILGQNVRLRFVFDLHGVLGCSRTSMCGADLS